MFRRNFTFEVLTQAYTYKAMIADRIEIHYHVWIFIKGELLSVKHVVHFLPTGFLPVGKSLPRV